MVIISCQQIQGVLGSFFYDYGPGMLVFGLIGNGESSQYEFGHRRGKVGAMLLRALEMLWQHWSRYLRTTLLM